MIENQKKINGKPVLKRAIGMGESGEGVVCCEAIAARALGRAMEASIESKFEREKHVEEGECED